VIYLLDTNAVIALLNYKPRTVRHRFRAAITAGASLVTSTVVLFELQYGVAKSRDRKANAERLRIFRSGGIGMIAFDEDDAAAAGELRAELERAGTPIGPYDVLIGAQARRREATIVTANFSEFARIHGLLCEDWAVH
jgi:tRNA(fMet)-specific endonuclease VapC